jgi:RNA polymerase sigma-70 factor (ECF subfamily)
VLSFLYVCTGRTDNHLETATPSEKLIRITTADEFEALFRAHYSVLCSYANHFLKDIDAAEEVVQEVMLRIWTNRESLIIGTSMKSYLFRAVRNGCMNVLKHLNIREDYRSYKEREAVENQRSQEDEMIMAELELKIRRAIDHLPMERRKVFILSRYEGLTYNQIAAKLGISVKTVENQMGKALKSLREELSDYLPLLLLFFYDWFRN